MASELKVAKCPRCRHATATDTPAGWYCHHCKMEFAEDDDGTTGYGDPSRFLERKERKPKKPFWAKGKHR